MSDMVELMADSLLIRKHVPKRLRAKYDRLANAAFRAASYEPVVEDARRLVDFIESDFRPLAPVIELHGHPRGVG